MIELARHIEILLLENDCVIIPDFGGFIAHYQPARYIKEENLYLPPVRTIGFNPQLTINDGLLAQSYMQAHHTDFPDATRMIEEEVAGLKEQLYQNGCAEMHGIGVLHYNIHSTYEFHPNEDGALSPTLYGLSSFSITRLEYLTSTTSATTRELLPQQEKRKRTVRFKRQWIGNAVAVAIAVVLFFFLSVPVENTYVDKGNYASLGTDGLFDAIRSQSLATTLITVPSRPQQPKKTNIKNNQNTLKPVTVKGLRITTHCRYFKFTKSRWLSVTENFDKSVIEIKFPRGFRSSDIVDRRIEVLKDFELIETDFTRIKKVLVNLNGLVLTKLVTDVYNYSQLLVEDIDDFIMDFDELQCKILIPKTRNFDTQTYLDLISKNPYLEIVDSSELEVLANYYNINIVNEDVVINSTNEFVFSAKKKYSKYLLEMIDIQDSFNTQLSGILKDYGVELIRYPIDSNVHNVNHIVFRITDLGAQESHKTDQFPLRYAAPREPNGISLHT